MNHRCPLCRMDLGQRKLGQAIIARLELDCPFCMNRIRLNLHPAETVVALLNLGMVIVLAVLAYRYQNQGLAMAALGIAMAGLLVLPLLEKTWLRDWPRYARLAKAPQP
jgi:hypothetical protein